MEDLSPARCMLRQERYAQVKNIYRPSSLSAQGRGPGGVRCGWDGGRRRCADHRRILGNMWLYTVHVRAIRRFGQVAADDDDGLPAVYPRSTYLTPIVGTRS